MTPSFANPLPGVVLGDPFVLRWLGRFYLYGTNDGPPLADGRQIPGFRSDDLIHWEPIGGVLEPTEPGLDHWAPEVLAWNGRFFMVVSFGDVDRRGHELWVATADGPEGPFRMTRRISDPSERFSIDGSWLLDDDGQLYLYRCLDFVAEGTPPFGTGIVVQPMADPLTPLGPPRPVLRAHAPWHLFEANRTMPLYGGRTFPAWTTIEGPAPVRRAGRIFCGYSGGHYGRAYGTGEAVADDPLGPYTDLRGAEGPLFGTTPGLVEGPGHFSVVRPDGIHDWIVLHGRTPGESVRRVWLCPASWTAEGVAIGPLTDQPQPAPPLPGYVGRFVSCSNPGAIPPGWRSSEGIWALDAAGFRHDGPAGTLGHAWFDNLSPLPESWFAEIYLRFPTDPAGEAGITIGAYQGGWSVILRPVAGACVVEGVEIPLPDLGSEPFNPQAWHALSIRTAIDRTEVRVDGVVMATDIKVGPGPARFGLEARGSVLFGSVALTEVD